MRPLNFNKYFGNAFQFKLAFSSFWTIIYLQCTKFSLLLQYVHTNVK